MCNKRPVKGQHLEGHCGCIFYRDPVAVNFIGALWLYILWGHCQLHVHTLTGTVAGADTVNRALLLDSAMEAIVPGHKEERCCASRWLQNRVVKEMCVSNSRQVVAFTTGWAR